MKMPKFGTKSALFGYGAINQHFRICLIAKFPEKPKTSKFGIKNTLLEYFWATISKNYCHISNQLPRICLVAKI